MIKHAISVAKKRKRKIGICGDAPSTYPEFAEFLVDCGIDSISLSPDAVLKMFVVIGKHEKGKKKTNNEKNESYRTLEEDILYLH